MIGLVMMWLASAQAAPFGWRWDGSADSAGGAPTQMTSASWSVSLPSTGNASPVVAGSKVCGASEPTTLWCADAASGRLLWSKPNQWVDTLSGDARVAGDAKMKAGEAAVAELAAAQSEYSKLQRDARRSTDDPTIFTRLTDLSTRMETLKKAAAEVEDYRTPSTRGLMGWSSPTPVSDGTSVYALFANGVVSKFDLAGNRQWSVWLGPSKQEMRGYHEGIAASPVLVDDVLVVPYGALHGLDVRTGQLRWSNGVWLDFGTPAVARVGGASGILTPDGRIVDPHDGRTVQSGLADVWYTSPVVAGDHAFWIGGRQDAHTQSTGGVMARAVRLTPSGSSLRADPIWSVPVSIPERFYAAPVVHDGVVYAVSKDRTIVALRESDGAQLYMYSLTNLISGEAWPNPVIAGGVLYVSTDLGEVLSVRAGPAYETIAVSKVGPMLATPAVVGGRMVFRTFKSLVAYGG